MADIANPVGSSAFQTFKAATKNPVQTSVTQPKPQVAPQAVKEETPEKQSKLDKAMPYIATGASVVAVGASTIAIVKSKNSKAVLKKLEKLEEAIKTNGTAAPINKETIKNTTSFIVGILGAATGGAIVNHFDSNKDTLKQIGMSDDEINNFKTKAESAALQRENKEQKLENSANEAINKANNAENKANSVEGKANQAIDTANSAMSRANAVSNQSSIAMNIHRKPYYGLNLMVVNNNEKYMNQSKINSAIEDVHNAVVYRTGRKAGQTQQIISDYRKKYVPLMKSNSTWALTAEFDPIKAGGLGSVPMEIQNNFADMGIDNPVFIPMYQQKGKAEFIEYGKDEKDKSYKYIYGGETFDLKKMAEMPVQQYRGNKVVNQNVEFFVGHPKRQGVDGKKFVNEDQQIIFVKNSDNFGGDIYANNVNADEPEKFAFFSKAVYQLAEAKVSQALGKNKTGLGEIKVVDKDAFESVNPPVSMILNDWHAAPMAGLLRYKAPMENAYNVIDDNVKDALRDMPLLMIGHNAGIPGSTRSNSIERSDMLTENVINTLYDSYSFGITENAHTGREPESVCNSILYERNDENNRQFNNLAHGISLSDYYVPVSKNYEKELKEDAQNSGIALNIIEARKGNDTISGEVNGLDRSLNTTEAKAGWLKSKFGINLQAYNHLTPIDDVMAARQHNKMEFYDNFLKPVMDKEPPKGGFKYDSIGEPANVSREDFENAPLIAFAHRLTPQKGLAIFEKAVQNMYNTWDEKHPGQPKPVIIAGGELEDGTQAQYLHGLKDKSKYNNPDDVNRIQVLKGFMPNPSLYSAVTYFCAPSTFEPCGLTQGECYAMGTPIITTATGGFVDTITDGKNGFVAPYKSFHKEVERNGVSQEQWLQGEGNSLADKFNEGMDVFFNNKNKYKSIVENNLNENLSWNKGSNDDPIHGYINRLAINKEDNVEANVASVRKYIAPILKEFDKLQKGKISEKDFEKNTPILKLADKDKDAVAQKDKIFAAFGKINDKKQADIEQNISTLDKHISDFQAKIDIDNNDSSSKGKLEVISLKKGMEKDKLDTVLTSDKTVERDRQMFEKLINVYAHNKKAGSDKVIDLKSPEYADFNDWKTEIISKY